MIKLISKSLNISTGVEAQAHSAFNKEGSSYNGVTKELTITQKEVTGEDWRLIHDGKKVVALIEGQGITYTLDRCLEFKTEKEALAEIDKMGLINEVGK